MNRNVRLKKDGFRIGLYEVEVDSYGVKDHEEHSTEFYSWQEISKIAYSQDDVYIYIGKKRAIIIPGRSFADQNIRESFFEIVERNIPKQLINRSA